MKKEETEMQEINDKIKEELERVTLPICTLVHDLPTVEESKENTIYFVQQQWMMLDGKWVRLS